MPSESSPQESQPDWLESLAQQPEPESNVDAPQYAQDTSEPRPMKESEVAINAAIATAAQLTAFSVLPAAEATLSSDHGAHLRELTVLGLPRFFDHSGNFIDGSIMAMGFTFTAGAIIFRLPERAQPPALIATGLASTAFASEINVLYESSVHSKEHPNATYDSADVLYGSAAGALVSLAFCAGALYQRFKLRKQARQDLIQ